MHMVIQIEYDDTRLCVSCTDFKKALAENLPDTRADWIAHLAGYEHADYVPSTSIVVLPV